MYVYVVVHREYEDDSNYAFLMMSKETRYTRISPNRVPNLLNINH